MLKKREVLVFVEVDVGVEIFIWVMFIWVVIEVCKYVVCVMVIKI